LKEGNSLNTPGKKEIMESEKPPERRIKENWVEKNENKKWNRKE